MASEGLPVKSVVQWECGADRFLRLKQQECFPLVSCPSVHSELSEDVGSARETGAASA